ncbi:MAG: hypothetical protein Fur0043_20440 [Anaerolineales bacterium]
MKKTILIITLVVLALGALGVNDALAQGQQPPVTGYGSGLLHEYMVKAMAEAVGLSVNEFESRQAAGETFYQIALSKGFTAEEIPALMLDARARALAAAVADGLISQEQAEWMNSHGFGRGGMMGVYGGNGTCPLFGATASAQTFSGFTPGQGMMGGRR